MLMKHSPVNKTIKILSSVIENLKFNFQTKKDAQVTHSATKLFGHSTCSMSFFTSSVTVAE